MVRSEVVAKGLKVTLYSDPFEIRAALQTLLKSLEHQNIIAEERGTVELVLAEVLNNIAEHAYQEATDGAIEVTVQRIESGIQCQIFDYGLPMPNGETPLGKLTSLNVDIQDLPEGGFGSFLIQELAKDLTYTRQDAANHLSFRMVVGR